MSGDTTRHQNGHLERRKVNTVASLLYLTLGETTGEKGPLFVKYFTFI